MNMETYAKQFVYDPSRAGQVGVERECFITDQNGAIVPEAARVLSFIGESAAADSRFFYRGPIPDENSFGYELSACQLETRVGPCALEALDHELAVRERQQTLALRHFGLSALHTEVGPEDMPLDVYPDPTGRYQQITATLPIEVLRAACRVVATHVHVGMPDHETALSVYNHVIRYYSELCELGNGSFGERLAIYREMAPDYYPQPYASWDAYYQYALEKGFAEDPRKCWTLIRISKHGTIEFRMFGATPDRSRIVAWAKRCHAICMEGMLAKAA
jgi:gamma-glutamyl:cysteine ligase YbdK (ATP-grasp superfamily)